LWRRPVQIFVTDVDAAPGIHVAVDKLIGTPQSTLPGDLVRYESRDVKWQGDRLNGPLGWWDHPDDRSYGQ
jgi:hypothetical protein